MKIYIRICSALLLLCSLTAFSNSPNKNAPYGFIENKGQFIDQSGKTNAAVLFQYEASSEFKVHLNKNGFSYECLQPEMLKDSSIIVKYHRIDIALINTSPSSEIIPENASSDYINYYTPGTGENGATEVKHYEKIRYKNIYPNIDMLFSIKGEGQFKYDFIVHPGGDINNIQLKYNGQNDLSLEANGSIKIANSIKEIIEDIPVSFLQIPNERTKKIKVKYIEKSGVVGFLCPAYPKEATLVIDPQPSLIWGTYYGAGAGKQVTFNDCDLDLTGGNLYVVGSTNSTNSSLVVTNGAYQSSYGGGTNDAIVTKFDSLGNRIWATYYGGLGVDNGERIVNSAIDGSVVIFGTTQSATGMATISAYQTASGGGEDCYLAKFNYAGIRQWGTYYGGPSTDGYTGQGAIVLDKANGDIVLTSITSSTTKISTTGTFQPSNFGGGSDAMIAKFNSSGTTLKWGTYYGGEGTDAGEGIAMDNNGNIIIIGQAGSATNIASSGAHQAARAGQWDAFIAKFDPTGTIELWSTYYGGANGGQGIDDLWDVAVDQNNNIIAVGQTSSPHATNPGVIASPGAFQTAFVGGGFIALDAMIVKFNPSGVREWGTYYGGGGGGFFSANETIHAVTIGKNGDIMVCGSTPTSTVVATPDAYQTVNGGGNGDLFIAEFSAAGSRKWSTFYGGSGLESFGSGVYCIGLSIDTLHSSIYVASMTQSPNQIATSGAFQTAPNGSMNGVIAKFSFLPNTLFAIHNYTICEGTCATFVDSSSGSPTSWNWAFSGANITSSTLQNPVACFAAAGTYTMSLSTSNSHGSGGTYDTSIVVLPKPSVTSVAELTLVCGNTSTYIEAFGADSYQWGPGTFLDTQVGAIVNSTPASSITYSVVGTTLGCKDTSFVSITVSTKPTLDVSSNVSLCAGESTVLTADGTGLTYEWSPATWLDNTASPSVTSTPLTPGTTTYTVTGINALTCTNTALVSVTGYILPNVLISPEVVNMCAGNSTTLSAFSAAGDGSLLSYSWSPGDYLSNSNAGTVIFTPPQLNTYNYTLTLTDNYGCMDKDTVTILVIAVLPVDAGNNQTVCFGEQVTLSGSGASNYQWTPAAGLNNAAIANPSVTPSLNIQYSLLGTSGNCSATDSVSIVVNPLPVITNSGNTSLCYGGQTNISAGGGVTYVWNPITGLDNASAQFVIAAPASSTSYVVTGTDSNNCSSISDLSITVYSTPVVDAGKDTTILLNKSTILSASGGAVYEWSPAEGLSNTSIANPTANPKITTKYYLTGWDSHGCIGVVDSVTITVEVPCTVPYIPNAFSPNQDGQNDKLVLGGNDCFSFFSFIIVDRWGETVFKTSDFSERWDGTFRAKELEPAVFVYVCSYSLFGGANTETLQGNITLVK